MRSRASHPRIGLRSTALVVAFAFTFVACNPPATAPDPTEGTASQAPASQAPSSEAPAASSDVDARITEGLAGIAAVFEEVSGLEGEERRARLTEMAAEEGNQVSFYGSTQVHQSGPILTDFEDLTGVETIHYRAGGNTIATKIIEEADAGFDGADVVIINAAEIILLEEAGLLAPLDDTPVRADIIEAGQFDTWLAVYINAFVYGWNTNNVDGATLPATHEEMLRDFEGTMVFDIDNYDWLFALVNDYFIGELGWTEEQAIELITERMRKSRLNSGNSLTTQLLAAGEYDMTPTAYASTINEMAGDGAPVAWYPGQPNPVFVRPNGIGIVSNTARPAAAILLLEYWLTDGQEALVGFGRTPGSTAVSTGGLPPEVETLNLDIEAFDAEEEKWRTLWEGIIAEAGQTD
jgi:iron(III) transport system substrate-binding protein